ncbi:septum formation initiator family protein [bacterium]|nr:septum formation initiator family protein [bacterium]
MNGRNIEQQNIKKRQKRYDRKVGFYYSFLTIVLIFCLIQIGYGAILNVSKIVSYQGKVVTLENLLKEAKQQNEDLKVEKKMVTSDNSLEGIARNNLKMAGEDEVLIIINKKVETPKKKKNLTDKFKNFSLKKEKNEQDTQIEKPFIPEEVVEE